LREICPPKKKTPKSGANIGAIAGELLKVMLRMFHVQILWAFLKLLNKKGHFSSNILSS
jgi:hypothetical protein